jgi:hypothetical protein
VGKKSTEDTERVKRMTKRVRRGADDALARIDALAQVASAEMGAQTAALEELVLRTRQVTDDLVARTQAAAEQAERQQQLFDDALASVDGSVAEVQSQLRVRVSAVDRRHEVALAHLDAHCAAATERLAAVDDTAACFQHDVDELLARQQTQADDMAARVDRAVADAIARHEDRLAASATRFDAAADEALARHQDRLDDAAARAEGATDHAIDQLRAQVDAAAAPGDTGDTNDAPELGAEAPFADGPAIATLDPEPVDGEAAPWDAPVEPREPPAATSPTDALGPPEALVVEVANPWELPAAPEPLSPPDLPPPDLVAPPYDAPVDGPPQPPASAPALDWSAPTPMPTPMPSWEHPEPEHAAPAPAPGFATPPVVRPAATGSIMFRATTADLLASLTHLGRTAADGWLHAQLVHAGLQGQPATYLRLTIHDLSGWWEHHDIVGTASAFSRQSAVFGLAELVQAIRLDTRANRDDTVTLAFAGDITVGTTLVPAQHVAMPLLEGDRHKIERIDLARPDQDGIVLQSQAGRLVVPSRLASLLRSRRATDADLITIGDTPCLCAHVAGPTDDVGATITAPLSSDGAVTAADRRVPSEDPVAQLLGALSSTSSAEDVTAILNGGVSYARRRAAAHPALPPELIAAVLRDGTEAMRSAAASNPSLPHSSIAAACTDPAPVVRMAVAAHPGIPPGTILQLARDDDRQVRRRVVANPSLPHELLTVLADDPDPSVRAAVAAHPDCPVETLVTLTHDATPSVCAAVADNPGCPLELLDDLVAVVPEVVLANPRAPEHLLVAGSQVRSRHLRAAVAANPATPARQLQQLARDPDLSVVAALAENDAAPSSARRRARRRASHKGAVGDETAATPA